jgi:hypothetical protein
VARITVRIALQIVLVFGFGFPEVTGGLHFSYHFARQEPGCVHVGNRFFRNPLLLLARVKDGRTVAGSPVIALAVERARVVNLEEIFEQLPIRELERSHPAADASLDERSSDCQADLI